MFSFHVHKFIQFVLVSGFHIEQYISQTLRRGDTAGYDRENSTGRVAVLSPYAHLSDVNNSKTT